MIFNVNEGGMGDAIVALWIAEGAKAEGIDVKFKLPGYQDIIKLFGHECVETDEVGIRFGGSAPSYSAEIQAQYHERRVLAWQMEMDKKVIPKRPICNLDTTNMLQHDQDNRPLILLFPWANFVTRSWPIHKWIKLAWELNSQYQVIALHHEEKEDLKVFPRYMWGYGIQDVMKLMKIADLVIANDSGSAHMAGTLGTATLALMGPTKPDVVFGHCEQIIPISVSRSVLPCVACHFKGHLGFSPACDRMCDALALLRWEDVATKVREIL